MDISFHFSGKAEKAPRLSNSLGLSKTRLHFYPGAPKNKDKYAVYAEKIILKEGKTVPKNNWRFVYQQDGNSNVVYKINKASLQKRLGISAKELKGVTDHHYENLIQQKLSEKGVQFNQEIKQEPIVTDNSKLLKLLETLPPPILPLEGQFKHSSKEGTVPKLIETGAKVYPMHDTNNMYAVAMSACFHSDLRIEETSQCIQDICEATDSSLTHPLFVDDRKGHGYSESKGRLYNNLVNLHKALPGEELKKWSKIYWTDSVEKELIPYLLKNENVDPLTLGFIFTHGEVVKNVGEAEGVFQAEGMNAYRQLQFVALSRQRKAKELVEGIKTLVPEVTGHREEEVEKVIKEWQPKEREDFFIRTELLTFLNQAYTHLYEAAKEGKKLEFNEIFKVGK